MIQIKEISVGFPTKIANGITIQLMPFSTDATSCNTYYRLLGKDNEQLAEGNSQITEERFAKWGQDMIYIEDVVLANLGLTRIILK